MAGCGRSLMTKKQTRKALAPQVPANAAAASVAGQGVRSGKSSGSSGPGPFLDTGGPSRGFKEAKESKDSRSGQMAGLLSPYSPGDWSRVPVNIQDEIKTARNRSGSMEYLFGDLQGVGQLIELSLAWFADDRGGLDLDWYIDAETTNKRGTQRSIEPSRLNRDLQEQTCEEYKHRLFVEGQPQSVAGRPAWAWHVGSKFSGLAGMFVT